MELNLYVEKKYHTVTDGNKTMIFSLNGQFIGWFDNKSNIVSFPVKEADTCYNYNTICDLFKKTEQHIEDYKPFIGD